MEDAVVVGMTFGEVQFGAAQLGDRRRTARLVELANRMANHPGGTLPDKVNSPASLKGLYRLMDCAEVTHRSVLEAPRQRTLEQMAAAEGTVLVIHDGSELDFTGLKSIATLGPIGNGGNRGYVAHNVLAVVAETREVLGLAFQHLAKRPKVTQKETRKDAPAACGSRIALVEDRQQADSRSRSRPPASGGGGPGADVLEFLDFVESERKHYLVRSKHNRRISLGNGEETKLHDFARKLPERGRRIVEVAATAQRAAHGHGGRIVGEGHRADSQTAPRRDSRRAADDLGRARGRDRSPSGCGALGMDSPDQCARERPGGCERADRLVPMPLDRGRVPQSVEDGLPDRRHAVYQGRPPSTGHRIDLGGSSEPAATARR